MSFQRNELELLAPTCDVAICCEAVPRSADAAYFRPQTA
jgi:hypothetical protein